MKFGVVKRFILFGGGPLLSELYLLLEKKYEVFIVTSKRRLDETVINNTKFKTFLKNNDISYINTNTLQITSVLNLIDNTTIGISFGAPWIFDKQFINRFDNRLLNCHGSRLPHDRGAGGFTWRILNKDNIGASLIHIVDSGIDTGDIIKYEEYFYPSSCRKPIDYYNYSYKMNIEFFKKFIQDIDQCNEFEIIHQQESFSTYFPRINTEINGYIDWHWDMDDIDSFICAFDDPYVGASTYVNTQKVHLKDCSILPSEKSFHPFINGMIYRTNEHGILVAAKGGTILVRSVCDDNGVSIINNLALGDRFYTPYQFLEKAKTYRACYTPNGFKKIDNTEYENS